MSSLLWSNSTQTITLPRGTHPNLQSPSLRYRTSLGPKRNKTEEQNRAAAELHQRRPIATPTKMASSMAIVASVQPVATVRGLGGSSLNGTKLAVRPQSRRMAPRTSLRSSRAVVAKYGDKSVYFDLEDLPNTTGQWDLYGSDAPSPYNSLQSKFFETLAAPFTKRGLLLKFLILGGGFTLAYYSSTASGDILPIKKGPQLPPQLGPRDKK